MSVVDLYARHVSTKQEYLQNIADTTDDFTSEEKEKISKCAKMSDAFYNTMNFTEYDYYKFLNGKEIARVIGSIDFADENFINWLKKI